MVASKVMTLRPIPFVVEPVLVEHDAVNGEDLRRAGESVPADPGEKVWGDTIGRLPWP